MSENGGPEVEVVVFAYEFDTEKQQDEASAALRAAADEAKLPISVTEMYPLAEYPEAKWLICVVTENVSLEHHALWSEGRVYELDQEKRTWLLERSAREALAGFLGEHG